MTTSLLPRLIATGALAAGLSVGGAVAAASSSHAASPVTVEPDGTVLITLTYAQEQAAAVSQADAVPICSQTIVPAVEAISPGLLPAPICISNTWWWSAKLLPLHTSIVITLTPNGVGTAAPVA